MKMPNTSRPAEALEVSGTEPNLLLDILEDVSLTPAEKSLMIEALFVHDAAEPSAPSQRALEQTQAEPFARQWASGLSLRLRAGARGLERANAHA
jgi:hypothetical protein